jgi:tetratricopeptide (TPR) repeat protein
MNCYKSNPLLRLILILSAGIGLGFAAKPAISQSKGSVAGTILNGIGKPWPGLTVTFCDPKMQPVTTVITDDAGKYRAELPAGTYILLASTATHGEFRLAFVVFPDAETPGDLSFNTFRTSYPALQEHVGNGERDLSQVKKSREQIDKLQAELDQAGDRAIEELRKALAATDEKNSFFQRSGVLSKLGDTYDAMGEYAAAARAYRQAVDLRRDPVTYANLSNDLAKSGKFEEAAEACSRSAELDPSRASHAYLNLAINLYNALRYKDAVTPAQKVTEIDSGNAKGWYVLAAALAASIEYRTDTNAADRVVPSVPPGTLDAFQRVITLDPKGEWGKLAREGMAQLQQIQSGTDSPEPPKPIH